MFRSATAYRRTAPVGQEIFATARREANSGVRAETYETVDAIAAGSALSVSPESIQLSWTAYQDVR